MSHEQATVAEEEYLQIIYWLQEAGLPITGANIARAMQVSAPTVHEMIGRLEARRLRHARAPTSRSSFTDSGREHASADRAPPPPDRALPHRRLRHPLGPGARGGRAARALDVADGRGAHAARDRRRQDLPARPPDLRGRARDGRAAGRRRGGREGARPALRERGRGPAPLPDGHGPAARASRARSRARATTRSWSTPATSTHRSRAAWPRPSRWWPTPRRRRAPPCRTSSCWARSATGASAQ